MASAFDRTLERLVAAYEKGRLVPFIGAGMSVPTCPGWAQFITSLERTAGTRPRSPSAEPDALIRRAHTAVRTLRNDAPLRFADRVRHALIGRRHSPPKQTEALARTWWPLVLTTNYDNCFVTAFRERTDGRNVDVLGRNPEDCQRVLSSLTSPSRTLVWALQGFLGAPCPPAPTRYEARYLERELVVGHAEYRSVTYRELHFRRAFAEVYRNRSLLFVGSGLRDPYLLELFGEILETYGPSSHPHYALIRRGELTEAQRLFLRERYQTEVFEYRNHGDLPRYLDRLADTIERSSSKEVRWGYSLSAPHTPTGSDDDADFEVVRAHLPLPDASRKQCLAVNAIGTPGKDYAFSRGIHALLRRAGVEDADPLEVHGDGHVARFSGHPIYAVLARSKRGEHDLRLIARATGELLDCAWDDGHRHVLLQLLAAGRQRIFPVRMPFIQIARAYAQWRREHPRRRLRLSLHVVAPAVTAEIGRGRLDVIELLTCTDIRFWVIVDNRHDEPLRVLLQRPAETGIDELAAELRTTGRGWHVLVYPPPYEDEDEKRLVKARRPTLESRGVVSGSTLVFTKRKPGQRD